MVISDDRPGAGGTLLTADVALLQDMFDAVLAQSGAGDVLRAAQDLKEAVGAHRGSSTLSALSDGFSVTMAEQVARALTVHFHLVNPAEERHRVRLLRASDPGVSEQPDLPWPALQGEPVDPQVLQRLRIHAVVTAHPTEARRRAVTGALRRIAHQLDRYDDPRRGPTSASRRSVGEGRRRRR